GSQGDGVTAVFAPRAGNTIITINTRPNPGGAMYYLVVDGKKIDASECINNINKVVFSPDGKRYMARCNGQGSVWMIVDGKKELEYQGIGDDFGFSADSTKYAYIASNASKQFVITDGAESSPYDMIFTKPIFSPAGAHLAYIGGANRLSLSQVVDGKVVGQLRDVGSIGFSADGSHFAFLGGTQGGDDAQHIIDGTPQKEIIANDILFTPDGKHVRLIGQRIRDRQNGLFVDGQVIYRQVGRFVRTPVFSPDSNHIYWSTVEVNQSVQPPRQSVLYVDGKAIGKWNGDANAAFEQMPESWEIAPDGVLTYLVIAPEGVKRLRVTPDANTTLASIVSDVKAAEEKAAADAAKSKADAEALRAKQAADAQKAREDAAAARAKARQDAIDARVKAQQDAAAARAARRGGTR
ncbi:MAG TPA: hypothetical protein VHD56_07365, partial [Tepidisphaeraceae bacterium]|nr:hypothetical protein [Tepidisphaeraceae bacterium]